MASLKTMSYAEIDLAIVPEAPPAWKNSRATSWPAPISANVPYFGTSRLIVSAFWVVVRSSLFSFTQGTLAAADGVATRSCVTSTQRPFLLVEGLKPSRFYKPHEKLHHVHAGGLRRAGDLHRRGRPAVHLLRRRACRHGVAEEGHGVGCGLVPCLRPFRQHHRR